MTLEQAFLLALIVAALVLFASEKLRADVVAIGVSLTLVLSGILTAEQGVAGFSSPAVITVIGMFILSAGLVRTGVADRLGDLLLASGVQSMVPLLLLSMLLCGLMSAFMNNIAAVAILLPTMFAICERKRISPSKLLIPVAFGSLLGGLTTLVGTPPNLLASQALANAGYDGFRMFDFAPTGLAVLGAGLLYMALLGHRLIPVRMEAGRRDSLESLRRYITEVLVPPGSGLVGKSMSQARLREDFGLAVLRMHRRYRQDRNEGPNDRPWLALGRYGHDEGNGSYSFVPWPETVLQAGDHLILEGDPDVLLKRQGKGFLELVGSEENPPLADPGVPVEVGEVALAPNSHALGSTVQEVDFQERYGVQVLAVRRSGQQIADRVHGLRLETGDVLLVRGTQEAMAALAHNPDFLVVRQLKTADRDHRRLPVALAIMLLVVGSAVSGWMHISTAALLGALLMTLSGCVPVRELYSQIDWRVIFLIACMMPLGTAMDASHTGLAAVLADGLLWLVGGSGHPLLVLVLLMVLTAALTQVMSNAACVVLVAPIAIAVAQGMGILPQAFVMAVAIAASTAFLTPIGHQANLLVYGVGNYRFGDFFRVGGVLTLLIIIVSAIVVPLVWPMTVEGLGALPPTRPAS